MTVKTPVVLVVFNRPAQTRQVLRVIGGVRPETLYVVADGPRAGRVEDEALCRETRALFDALPWPCAVHKDFAPDNLGCGRRPATGLDWVFGQVDRAIILEDDCVPDATFFRFCDELLDRYADDERVMMVSAMNLAGSWKEAEQSYHFSYYGSTWGWATWRRAWRHFNYDMPMWKNAEVQDRVRDVLAEESQFAYRKAVFDGDHAKAWDYQWHFARISQSGLAAVPAVNMMTNLGFGAHATHTKDANSPLAKIPALAMTFPLRHPFAVAVDRRYDSLWFAKNAPAGFQRHRGWRGWWKR